MGKKFIDPKTASTYKLVHKSVEDPTYEDENTASTMVHVTGKAAGKRTRGINRDIVHEEIDYRYDMHNPDDTVEDGLFDDQVEEEFGQDFIREMMMAPEGEEDEEDEDVLADYPVHADAKRDVDKEFDALMKGEYQQFDMEVEENDPRTEGLLPVEAYVPAMQEFIEGQKEGHFSGPVKDDGFVGRLARTGEEIFHQTNAGGQFLTVLTCKKDIDFREHYEEGMDEAKSLARAHLKAREEKGHGEDAPPELEYVKVKKSAEEKWDCQTILTTMSTLENHPTVIAAEKGRIKINPRTGALIRTNKLTSKNLDKLGEESALERLEVEKAKGGESEATPSTRDEEEMSVGESLITVVDTTVKRNKKETADEKKARKQQVKEEKRQMRLAKKDLRTAYKAETIRQRFVDPASKQQKAMLSLR